MPKPTLNQGRRTYIWSQNSSKIDAFCLKNKMALNEALNHILDAHFTQTEIRNQYLSEINALRRKLDYISLILQPSLLELLEASGQLKAITLSNSQAPELGKRTREQFEDFFNQMIQRVKEKYHD